MSEKTKEQLQAELAQLVTRSGELGDAPFGSEGHHEQLGVFLSMDIIDAEIAMIDRISRHAQISATLGFHWKDGWFFKRQEDGSVRVVRFQPFDQEPQEMMVVDANSWCSIICAASGDYTSGRWDEARAFHRAD